MDISKIDKNFKVETKIERNNIRFYDADEAPFKVCGIFRENGKYRRMPEAAAKRGFSEGRTKIFQKLSKRRKQKLLIFRL